LSQILQPSFFDRDAVSAARDLLGTHLVRLLDGVRLSGIIVEAEAYRGEEDLACHARAGRTPRTQVMYGPPGRAYIYFTYGMHWMLNCVAGPENFPAAVLVRAVLPQEGLEVIAARRAGRARTIWCDGPGKLTLAFGIDGGLNGVNLCSTAGGLWLEAGDPVPDDRVIAGPRVGLGSTPEP